MAVKIRLRRMGQKNRPFYRVVVADSRTSNTGRFIETLGWYDPMKEAPNHQIDLDRLKYWTGNGAIPSDSVASLVKQAETGKVPVPKKAKEAPAPAAEEAPAEEAEAPVEAATEE